MIMTISWKGYDAVKMNDYLSIVHLLLAKCFVLLLLITYRTHWNRSVKWHQSMYQE